MSGIGDLLGGVINSALSGAGAGGAQAPGGSAAIMQAVAGLIHEHGGVAGLVEQFRQNGLAEVAQSWVGTGPNQAIDASQIAQALGSGPLGQFARQLGLDPATANGVLAQALPQVVDRLTPNGQAGAHGGLADLARQLLG